MSISALLKVYLLMTVVFFVIDVVWIAVVANKFFQAKIGFMLRPDVQWVPAVIFYLLFVSAVLVFAVIPGVERGSLARAVVSGAFLGLVCYATYDLTNLALTKGFPTIVAVVDMTWGALIAATIAATGYSAAGWISASAS